MQCVCHSTFTFNHIVIISPHSLLAKELILLKKLYFCTIINSLLHPLPYIYISAEKSIFFAKTETAEEVEGGEICSMEVAMGEDGRGMAGDGDVCWEVTCRLFTNSLLHSSDIVFVLSFFFCSSFQCP